MADEPTFSSTKRKYIYTSIAAAIFLLILPSVVIGIASNRTGIHIFQGEGPPPPEYRIIDSRQSPEIVRFGVRMAPGTTDEEMRRVTQDIVRKRYKGIPLIVVNFYLKPEPLPGEPRMVRAGNLDATFRWRLGESIAKIYP